jgi:hypothetical protein
VILDLRVVSERQLVAVGSSSFLGSTDGGERWRRVSVPGLARLGGGFVLDGLRWWAASPRRAAAVWRSPGLPMLV